MKERLYKSPSDRMLSGVSGGLGEYLDVDSTLVRIAWVIVTIMSAGVVLVVIGGLALGYNLESAYGSRNLEGEFSSPCGGASTLLGRYRDVASLDVKTAEDSPLCLWGADWKVYVPRVPEVVVDVEANVASVDLDLTDISVTELYVDANMGSVEIAMPSGAGHVQALLEAVGASIDIRIPEGVEDLIVNDSELTSFDVAGRFHRKGPLADGATVRGRDPGSYYESPGYRTAEDRVYIEVDARFASVNIR